MMNYLHIIGFCLYFVAIFLVLSMNSSTPRGRRAGYWGFACLIVGTVLMGWQLFRNSHIL